MLEGHTMLDIRRDITSLSNFQRHTREFLQRLKETARPVVLTVNGRTQTRTIDLRNVIISSISTGSGTESVTLSFQDSKVK